MFHAVCLQDYIFQLTFYGRNIVRVLQRVYTQNKTNDDVNAILVNYWSQKCSVILVIKQILKDFNFSKYMMKYQNIFKADIFTYKHH